MALQRSRCTVQCAVGCIAFYCTSAHCHMSRLTVLWTTARPGELSKRSVQTMCNTAQSGMSKMQFTISPMWQVARQPKSRREALVRGSSLSWSINLCLFRIARTLPASVHLITSILASCSTQNKSRDTTVLWRYSDENQVHVASCDVLNELGARDSPYPTRTIFAWPGR